MRDDVRNNIFNLKGITERHCLRIKKKIKLKEYENKNGSRAKIKTGGESKARISFNASRVPEFPQDLALTGSKK